VSAHLAGLFCSSGSGSFAGLRRMCSGVFVFLVLNVTRHGWISQQKVAGTADLLKIMGDSDVENDNCNVSI
jgi:hypothetical protein